jgi:hypothetical protein
MYAKAMKTPYAPGPAYKAGESSAASSANPETAPILEVRLLWALRASTQPNVAMLSIRVFASVLLMWCRGRDGVSQVEEDVPDYGAAKE